MPVNTPRLALNLSHLPPMTLAPFIDGLDGVDEWYLPVSDGDAAPLHGTGPGLVAAVAAASPVPCHVHLMNRRPGGHVALFADTGCKTLTVQLESCPHPHRVLGHIRDAGMSPGIALAPGTPLTRLDYLLALADRVLLLGTEPGRDGVAPGSLFERVKLLDENIRYRELAVEIGVMGGLDAAGLGKAARLGAKWAVTGPEVFAGLNGDGVAEYAAALERFKQAMTLAVQTA